MSGPAVDVIRGSGEPSVLLIDDDGEFTSMLAQYLSTEGFRCHQANSAVEGIEQALSGSYDAAILDIMMPQIDGIEVLRRIRRESMLPILMLTAKGDSIDRVVGLELGADDYLGKPAFPREVVARLRAVLRRLHSAPRLANHSPIEFDDLRVSIARQQASIGERDCPLTRTEFNILVELIQHAEEVVTKDELSERVLRRVREPYDRSVDVHVSNLRQKLTQAGSDVEIKTIRATGYMMSRRS